MNRPLAPLAVAVAALAAAPRVAAADPATEHTLGHVVTAPTAWMPAGGGLVATGGVDHHGDTQVSLTAGLGGIAAVTLDDDTDVRACHGCTDATSASDRVHLRRATFVLGVRPNYFFAHAPALAVGVRESWRGTNGARVGEAYVVASAVVGPVRLHAGAMAIDATDDRAPAPLGLHVRGFVGGEWTPSQYPRTSLIADLAYVPKLGDGASDAPTLGYVTALAARYQAFTWGSIELGARYRQGDELGATAFFVRANLLGR